VIFSGAVAPETTYIDFLGRGSFEVEDLFWITWILDMVGGCTVTSFASLFGGTTTLVECGFPVGGFVKVEVDILVAGLASLRSSILRGRIPHRSLLLPARESYKKDKHGQTC
jgi:hypothetical protein